MKNVFFVFVLTVFCAVNVFAQDVTVSGNDNTTQNVVQSPDSEEPKPIYVIGTYSSSTYRGVIIMEDEKVVVMKTDKGKIKKINQSNIKYITKDDAAGNNSSIVLSGNSFNDHSYSREGWNTFYVEYNSVGFDVDDSQSDDETLNAFSAGYNCAFPISSGTPVFIETGFGVQYSYKSDFYDWDDLNLYMLSAKAPLNLAFKYDIPKSAISLIPFAGATVRYNIIGKAKYTGGKKDENWNLFDKTDMRQSIVSFDGKAYNRLQFGWQIGLKAIIGSSFLVGISYGSDLSELTKKVNLSTTSIAVGCAF